MEAAGLGLGLGLGLLNLGGPGTAAAQGDGGGGAALGAGPTPEPPPPPPPRTAPHHRRTSTYGRLLRGADLGVPNAFAASLGPPPPYLRGTVRRWAMLKSVLARRVLAVVEGAGAVALGAVAAHAPDDLAAIGAAASDGCWPPAASEDAWGTLAAPAAALRDVFGFQPGPLGAARAAVEGLVADLAGCGGVVPTPDEAIALLHEESFENYCRWARMIGAHAVYSRRYDEALPRRERQKVAYVHATPPRGAGRRVRRAARRGAGQGARAQSQQQQQQQQQPAAGGDAATAAATTTATSAAVAGDSSDPAPHSSSVSSVAAATGTTTLGGDAPLVITAGGATDDGLLGGAPFGTLGLPLVEGVASPGADASTDSAASAAPGRGSSSRRSAGGGDGGTDDVGATAVGDGHNDDGGGGGADDDDGGRSPDDDDDDDDDDDEEAPGTPIGLQPGVCDDDEGGDEVGAASSPSRRFESMYASGDEDDEDGRFSGDAERPRAAAASPPAARGCGGVSCCGSHRRPRSGDAPPPPAAAAADSETPPPPPPPPRPSGSDAHTRLVDLALLYCIRAEVGNLRFTPELLCWLFHQMRFGTSQPPAAAVAAAAPPPGLPHETGFFHSSCALPLYRLLRSAAVCREPPVDRSLAHALWTAGGLCGRGRSHALANSERVCYDDVNESFWHAECLRVAWHAEDAAAGVHTLVFRKTFFERSGYLSVALAFWRWWAFLAVMFTAVSGVARAIVDAGGINLTGIARVNPVAAGVNATACFLTLAYAHTALVLLSGVHGAPPARTPGCARRAVALGCTALNAAKLAYSLAWSAGLSVLFFSPALLGGRPLFGTPVWFAAVGAKAGCVLLAETRVDALPCWRAPCCGRRGGRAAGRALRRLAVQLERVYVTTPAAGARDSVLGSRHVRQPLSRVAVYAALWAAMLSVKLVFDTHILVQQWRLLQTLGETAARGTPLRPLWDVSVLGVEHAFVVVGSWATLVLLYCLDSYIIFILAAALIGWVGMVRDGVGTVTTAGALRGAFRHGVSLSRRRPLAEQFVHKLLPLARGRGRGGPAAAAAAGRVFRRAWDAIVCSLRAGDLLSNAEQAKLMFGDAATGVEPALPLFLYAGVLARPLRHARDVATAASRDVPDGDFLDAALPHPLALDAAREVARALPALLSLVARSHSAVGADDPHVAATCAALLAPRPGQSVREAVHAALTRDGDPHATTGELVHAVLRLCVEFERPDAAVGMRGSPLVAAAVGALACLARVRGVTLPAATLAAVAAAVAGAAGGGGPRPPPPPPRPGGWDGSGGDDQRSPPPQPPPRGLTALPPSFELAGAPDLTAEHGAPRVLAGVASAPGGDRRSGDLQQQQQQHQPLAASIDVDVETTPSHAGGAPAAATVSSPLAVADDGSTRTVGGLIRLLLTPCEGPGRL